MLGGSRAHGATDGAIWFGGAAFEAARRDGGRRTKTVIGTAYAIHAIASPTVGLGCLPNIPVLRAEATLPGLINQLRSTAWSSRMFHHPAAWAVCTADDSSPAATRTGTTPMMRKKG